MVATFQNHKKRLNLKIFDISSETKFFSIEDKYVSRESFFVLYLVIARIEDPPHDGNKNTF